MSETATLEPPVVETTPELIVNRFDADGICQDPETVKVLMPKGYTCLLYLAVDPDGGWRHGCDCSGSNGKEPLASMARLERPAFIDRRQALRMAMQEAMDYFVKNRKASKAVKALETFYAANLTTEEGSPANLSTDSGQAPPEGMETGPARGEFAEIPVAAISPNPANHRKHIDPDELAALAESIRLEGLLQPIAVRELPHEEMPAIADAAPPAPRYELILGERRWRAHELLKAASIQAKVYRSISAGRAKVLALIENLQRVNLNPIEEAEGYADLAEEGLQQDQIAERVGRSRPAVTNALRLLKLPAEVIAYIRTGKLTPAHGVAILRFDGWPIHERVMGDLAIRDKVRAGDMERGVPFAYELEREGIAVQIQNWQSPYKVTDKLKKHPAYFSMGEGDWACFDPKHWAAECEERQRQAALREEAAQRRREEELVTMAKSKKKQLVLNELATATYRKFEDDQAPLNELLPDEKKAVAKDFDGSRVTIATDVELADRLKAAWGRVIKKDRRAKVPDLEARVRKKIAALKKVGPREMAWLVYLIATHEGRNINLDLDSEAADRAGVKLPKLLKELEDRQCGESITAWEEREKKKRSIYHAFAAMDAADLVKVLMEETLPKVLAELIEQGPDCIAATMLRWWLDSDTLWLLEETDEGKAELLDQVKNAPWYRAEFSSPQPGDIIEWESNGGMIQGVVVTIAEYTKVTKGSWDWTDATPVKATKPSEAGAAAYHVIETKALKIVGDGEEEA